MSNNDENAISNHAPIEPKLFVRLEISWEKEKEKENP